MKPKIVIFIVCILTWLGMTWSTNTISLLVGVVVSLFVAFYTWDMFDPRFSTAKIVSRTIAMVEYFFVFFWECFKANIDVAYRVSHPAVPVHPGIVRVKTNLKSDLGITFLANSITLTPGTMSVDVDKEKGIIYIHWIEVKEKDIEKATKRICGRFESILRRIFE
jgi:multicomponent Na+:H+ antiporter subunit E